MGARSAQARAIASATPQRRYLPEIALPEALRVEPRPGSRLSRRRAARCRDAGGGPARPARGKVAAEQSRWSGCARDSSRTARRCRTKSSPRRASGARQRRALGPVVRAGSGEGIALRADARLGRCGVRGLRTRARCCTAAGCASITPDDVVGVEIGGAVKNVLAIAVGICDGWARDRTRARRSSRAASRNSRAWAWRWAGARETVMGLTGAGDLILTATGDLSRNRRVGLELARGKPLPPIVAELGHVAEGVRSAHATLARARLRRGHADHRGGGRGAAGPASRRRRPWNDLLLLRGIRKREELKDRAGARPRTPSPRLRSRRFRLRFPGRIGRRRRVCGRTCSAIPAADRRFPRPNTNASFSLELPCRRRCSSRSWSSAKMRSRFHFLQAGVPVGVHAHAARTRGSRARRA